MVFFLARQLTRSIAGMRVFEECLFLIGDSWNGKDTLIALMLSVLGDGTDKDGYLVPLDGSHFAQRARDPNSPCPALSVLQRARFVPIGELREDQHFNNEELKRLTEGHGTKIVSHGKYRDPTSWHPSFLMVFHANFMPRQLALDDKAIQRRLSIVQFPLRFVPKLSEPPVGNERLQDPTIKHNIVKFRDHMIFMALMLYPGLTRVKATRIQPIPSAVANAPKDYVEMQEAAASVDGLAAEFVGQLVAWRCEGKPTSREQIRRAFMDFAATKGKSVPTLGRAHALLTGAGSRLADSPAIIHNAGATHGLLAPLLRVFHHLVRRDAGSRYCRSLCSPRASRP
jgi:hypothetical protein